MRNKNLPSYLQETKDQHDKFQNPCIRAEVEEKKTSITSQDLEFDAKKIAIQLPVILDVMRPKWRQIKKPFSYKINFQDYLNLFYDNKPIEPVCDQSVEVSFDSLHAICGTLALLGFASEWQKCICKSVKQKRISNTSNMSSFSFELPAVEHLKNVIGSPSSKWAFDSVDTILRSETLRKFPLLFESVPPHVISEQASSPCSDKMSELTSNPTYPKKSENPEAIEIPVTAQRSEAKVCHERVSSSYSTTSSSSYNSGACAGCFATSAVLYCVWHGNIPTFLFSVDDGRGEMFVASPMKINCSIDRALDYVYIFRTLKVKRTRSLNNFFGDSSFIGRMKVSSSICLDRIWSKFVETQFVFFGAKEDNSSESKISPSNFTRDNGLSRKVSKIFKPSILLQHQTGQTVSVNSPFDNLQEMLRSELSAFDATDMENYLEHSFVPNNELVAIVVKDYGYESTNPVAFGGWGLKFLPKVDVHKDKSRDYLPEEFLCSENSSKTVNVIVPAGYHGGPFAESGGPSTIIERWKSLGHCDCGGWDAGCPLRILSNNSNSKTLANQDPPGDSTFELFIEGSKQDEPTMKLVKERGDVYQIYFQSSLSALQCFSIAVAIIHSRTPALSPQL